MKNLILSIFILTSSITTAQPTIQWEVSLGGTLNDNARKAFKQTPDGGFILAATSFSNNGDVSGHHGALTTSDVWLVKLDSVGVIEWQYSYGGTQNEGAADVILTADGGYLVCGSSSSLDGDVSNHFGGINFSDYWVLKVDSQGYIEWEKSYGGTDIDDAFSALQLPDGNYMISGQSSSSDGDVLNPLGGGDIWIIKIDTIGNLIWQGSYGGTSSEFSGYMTPTSDGGFIVGASTFSNDGQITTFYGGSDVWVFKIDSAGVLQWQKTYGGNWFDFIQGKVLEASNGDFMIVSQAFPSCNHGSAADGYFLRVNATGGGIIWQKCFGGTGYDNVASVEQTIDGGFLLAGYAASSNGNVTTQIGNGDSWLIKTNGLGVIEWQKSFGGTNYEYSSLAFTSNDNGIVMLSNSESNDVDVTGHQGGIDTSDVWIVKFHPYVTALNETVESAIGINAFPNPASNLVDITLELNSTENISITVYDLTGRMLKHIYSGLLAPESHKFNWDLTTHHSHDVENGIYYIVVNGGGQNISKKISVIR